MPTSFYIDTYKHGHAMKFKLCLIISVVGIYPGVNYEQK